MRGRNYACKGDRQGLVICKPPVPLVKLRNGRAIKESQLVKVGERIGYFIIVPVNFPNAVRRPDLVCLPDYADSSGRPVAVQRSVMNDIRMENNDAVPQDAPTACQVMRRSQIRYDRDLPDAERLRRS
jgi:hypothetical protein